MGIDPGLADTGFGIVLGSSSQIRDYRYGTISTSKTDTVATRLLHIFSELSSLLEAESPDLIVIEDIFSLKQYPKAGIALGKVCGVILLVCAQRGISTMEIAVKDVKRVLTGNGNAKKDQTERAVRHFLKRETSIRPSHASDAMALALVGLMRH
jgi:crossover junction endodeoxyribonuclease RuvC